MKMYFPQTEKPNELIDNRSTVTVAYKVRTLDAGSISASDFRAYIDLADMYELQVQYL